MALHHTGYEADGVGKVDKGLDGGFVSLSFYGGDR